MISLDLAITDKTKPFESLDLQLNLTPPKTQEKGTSLSCIHQVVICEKLLFIDLPMPKDKKESYVVMSLDQLKLLKKKVLKKYIKDYTLVSTPINASRILKSFGKILQLYNKTPTLVSGNYQLDSLEKKQFIRLEKNRLQCKLGNSLDSKLVLAKKIETIIELIKSKGYLIKSSFIKTTQGKKINL